MRRIVWSPLLVPSLVFCILNATRFIAAKGADTCQSVENGELDPTSGSRCSNIDAGDSSVPVDQQDQMPMDGSDLGEPQRIDRTQTDQFHYDDLTRHIEEARVYLASGELKAKQLSSEVIEHCRNNHELCGMWSLMGECDANPGYMKMNCAPVCHSCDFLTIEGRCNLEERGEDVWGPGDLEKLFRKLTEEPFFSQNDVQILSSPDDGGPWVITMENVVSEEEAKSLIALGKQEGYERSLDVGGLKYDGTTESVQSTDRTSTNAWCTSNACLADEAVQNVTNRISDLVGIPETNSEHFQMLRYEEGQFYKVHHDYIPIDNERPQGPRILTVYLYLNNVEEGGGTNFSALNLTVMPKVGRALLWSSVLTEQPTEKDDRTYHQALPVKKGVKFGTNMWFHLRDFKTPHKLACV